MSFIVAIDGPAGTGKGTVTELISNKLGFINVDTGAMYRCVALAMLQQKIGLEEIEKIEKLLEEIQIELVKKEEKQVVILNGVEVTNEIRSSEVTKIVSQVSSLKIVRYKMVDLQREMAKGKDVVMEGRDIGTYVFPNADVKIYLDASAEERATRRYKQNKEKGIEMSYEEVLQNILIRDENDKKKEMGALKIAKDATVIDTTNLTIEEVEKRVKELILQKKQEEKETCLEEKRLNQKKTKLWQSSKWVCFQRTVVGAILKFLYQVIFRVKTKGTQNVPKEGPFILCGNHVSFIKVPVMYFYTPRKVHFIGKAELFQNPILNWLGHIFEVIPVKRGKQDVDSMKKCLRTLKEDEPLAIFPEGTRNGIQKKVKVKTGAAYMALRTGVKIVPVGIYVSPKPFPKIILNYGKPLDYSQYQSKNPEKEVLEKVTQEMMDNIITLTNEAV